MSSANSANNSSSSNNNSGGNASHLSQLNDLRSYSRMWLTEFIELYRQAECLWLPKHADYSNHTARNKAYDRLVEKLKEVEPNPDRPMVIRKINSLRSAFRREYRKSSAKSNYETRLWYYDKLFFIANQHSKRLTASPPPAPSAKTAVKRQLPLTFDDGDSMEFEENDQEPQTIHLDNSSVAQVEADKYQNESIGTLTVSEGCVTLVKSEDHHHQQQQQNQSPQQQIHIQQQHQSNQPQHATAVKVLEITSLDSNSQREIQQAVNSLEHQHMQQLQQQQAGQAGQITQVPTIQIAREHIHPIFTNQTYSTVQTQQQHPQDEYDAIGLNVAVKLRCMNATQRIIAEKLISDVLFNGQLENLTINSTLSH